MAKVTTNYKNYKITGDNVAEVINKVLLLMTSEYGRDLHLNKERK